jgi:DNA modification methylase
MDQHINKIIHGECLEKLKEIESDSIDSIVTDPPYGYSFMGKDWDKAVPSVEVWQECLRVLKPGAFAFVMSAPRSDVCSRMCLRLEEAGFVISFTPIYWTYASGFPKAMNIGKAVDKKLGAERERVKSTATGGSEDGVFAGRYAEEKISDQPITAAAADLSGSYGGFQPKPAVEVIIVGMKPISEKTYIDQALRNRKGITWLDDARIPGEERVNTPMGSPDKSYRGFVASNPVKTATDSRFPANFLVSDDVLKEDSKYFSLDSWAETLPFLHVAKPSKAEKNKGLEKTELPVKQTTGGGGMNDPHLGSAYGSIKAPAKNFHPTVKPIKLMSYLITLGSRPGDTVLDPFSGSCTTLVAAKELKRNYIGIERESEYVAICEARLEAVPNSLF